MQSYVTSCRTTAAELTVGGKEVPSGPTAFAETYFTGEILSLRETPAIHLVQRRGQYFALKLFTPKDAPLAAVARLRHPQLVHVVGEQQRKDQTAYLLEYMPSTLFLELLMHGPLSEAKAAAVFQQVCEAVHYLHSNGFHHGDIRPETVLVNDAGVAKLTNLGSTQGLATASTKLSDVQALGRLLAEMLTNKPFEDKLLIHLPEPIAALIQQALHGFLSAEDLLNNSFCCGQKAREEAVLERLKLFMTAHRRPKRRPGRQYRRFKFDFSLL